MSILLMSFGSANHEQDARATTKKASYPSADGLLQTAAAPELGFVSFSMNKWLLSTLLLCAVAFLGHDTALGQNMPATGLTADFETNDAPWTSTGLWHRVATNSPCGHASSPTHSWYFGDDTTCTYDTGVSHVGILTSPLFVVPALEPRLTFWSRERTEGFYPFDTRKIYLRRGAASRILLHQSYNEGTNWNQIGPIDLQPYTGEEARLEFEFDAVDDAENQFAGWYIDDVSVAGLAIAIRHTPLADRSSLAPIPVQAEVVAQSSVASVKLVWRVGLGAYTTQSMQSSGADQYQATIPARAVGDVVRYYLEATDTSGALARKPADAPATTYQFQVQGVPNLAVGMSRLDAVVQPGENREYLISITNSGNWPVRWTIREHRPASDATPIASRRYPAVRPTIDWALPHAPDTLLVCFDEEIPDTQRASIHTAHGATRIHSFSLIPVDVVQAPAHGDLQELCRLYAQTPSVRYVEPNYLRRTCGQPNDPGFFGQWSLHNTGQFGGLPDADIDAVEAWDRQTGSKDIVVAVIDTGIDFNHDDLRGNLWVNEAEATGLDGVDDDGNGFVDDIHGATWIGGDGTPTDGVPLDGHGHGTHVSGTIGAVGNNGIGIAGINHAVRIMSLKFLADDGSGYDTDAIAALEYAVEMGAQVTNNSWGGSGFNLSLRNAIAAAGDLGQLFVAAAGNDGLDIDLIPTYPAAYNVDTIIAVTATDDSDARAYFSNWGRNRVHLAAPGVSILGTTLFNTYRYFSGTSMSTAQVTGVVALLLAQSAPSGMEIGGAESSMWEPSPDGDSYNFNSGRGMEPPPTTAGGPTLLRPCCTFSTDIAAEGVVADPLAVKEWILDSVDTLDELRVEGPTPVASEGRLNAAAALERAGVPWLELASAAAGTLSAGATTNVRLIVSGENLADGFSDTGLLTITSNDPDSPNNTVPVTLTVAQFLAVHHIPHMDTNDTVGPYPICAEVQSVDPIDLSQSRLYYKTTSQTTFQPIPLTAAEDGALCGAIPGHALGSTIQYYLVVRDTTGHTGASPADAPAAVHSFVIGVPSLAVRVNTDLNMALRPNATRNLAAAITLTNAGFGVLTWSAALRETAVVDMAAAQSAENATREILVNGDFETGDLTSWSVANTGDGAWVVNDGAYRPASGDPAFAPCQDEFAVITDMEGPGRHVLYQEIAIPDTANGATLSWTDRIRNHAEDFVHPDQEFRVELWNTENQTIARLFSTHRGDESFTGCTHRSVDISEFAGKVVRVVFIEEDSLLYLNVHLDRVSVTITEPRWLLVHPESGTLNPGQSIDLSVTFDSAGKTAPAILMGDLMVTSNDPRGIQSIPVTMNVTNDDMVLLPATPFVATGPAGGTFAPDGQSWSLYNLGATAISWTAQADQDWLALSPTSGTLAAGESTGLIAHIAAAATALPSGVYEDEIIVTNLTNGGQQIRTVTLTVQSTPGEIDVVDCLPPEPDGAMPFPVTVVGGLTSACVTIANNGAGALTVTDVSLAAGWYNEEFEAEPYGWSEDVDASWQVVAGEYRARGIGEDFMTAVYADRQWDNVSVAATLRRVGAGTTAAGVLLRASPDMDLDGIGSTYLFQIATNGSFSVWKVIAGEAQPLQDWTPSAAIRADENRLHASANEHVLVFVINDVRVWSGVDFDLPRGHVGVAGYTEPELFTTHFFDSVVVDEVGEELAVRGTALECAGSTALSNFAERREPVCQPESTEKVPPLRGDSKAQSSLRTPKISFGNQDFELSSIPNLPITLAPDESLSFDVLFHPATTGRFANIVRIESNDPASPRIDLSVTGDGVSVVNVDHLPLPDTTELGPFPVSATITAPSGVLAATLWWRNQRDQPFASISLASAGGGVFAGTIPTQLAGRSVDYYLQVTDHDGNAVTHPSGAPTTTHAFSILELTVGLDDDFDDDELGWIGSGLWHRTDVADPCSSSHSSPRAWHYGDDATCTYETGSVNAGVLRSPRFVVPLLQPTLTFWSWEQIEEDGQFDTRKIYVRRTDGTRRLLHQTPANTVGWRQIGPISLSDDSGEIIALEFEFHTVDPWNNEFAGWLIDDVVVAGANIDIQHAPLRDTSAEGDYLITATVRAVAAINSVTLSWRTDIGSPHSVAMEEIGSGRDAVFGAEPMWEGHFHAATLGVNAGTDQSPHQSTPPTLKGFSVALDPGSSTYQASIPAQTIGSVVQYYIEATDTLGNTARHPSTPEGTHRFQVQGIPVLSVTPATIDVRLLPDGRKTQSIVLRNTGNWPAHWRLVERHNQHSQGTGGARSIAMEADPPPIDWQTPRAPDTLLVRFKPSAMRSDRSAVHQRCGGQTIRSSQLLPLDVVRVPPGYDLATVRQSYLQCPEVAAAEPNYRRHAYELPNDSRFSDLWGLHNTGQTGGTPDADIDALEAWDSEQGNRAVVVAVIDTGVDYHHEDLVGNMWTNDAELHGVTDVDDDGNGIVDDIHGAAWTGGTGQPTSGDPFDDHNHGTHVAGTIGAVGGNGRGVVGVNHAVRVMALKFLNAQGIGYDADAIAAIEYAVAMGAHVMNASWGGGDFSAATKSAIEQAGAAGVLFVAAAGNESSNNDSFPAYPASYESPTIVAVAASDHRDRIASFSNWGLETVDLAAPGVTILSTLPNNRYGNLSGTSMATPHVTGVAALLLAHSGNGGVASAVAPEVVKSWILDGVDPVAAFATDGPSPVLTGGRLNAANALALSGIPWLDRGAITAGILAPDASIQLEITVDAAGLPDGFADEGIVAIVSDAAVPDIDVTVTLEVADSISIQHTGRTATNDTEGPYAICAQITSPSGVNTNELWLYYRLDSGSEFTRATVLHSTGAVYCGEIPGQPVGTEITYYLSAAAMDGAVKVNPPQAPLNGYRFRIGTPELAVAVHKPLEVLVGPDESWTLAGALTLTNVGFGNLTWSTRLMEDAESGIAIHPVDIRQDGSSKWKAHSSAATLDFKTDINSVAAPECASHIIIAPMELDSSNTQSAATSDPLINGDFETGDLTGWSLIDSPNGQWAINDGDTLPASGAEPVSPCGDNYDAFSDTDGPGIHTLFQDVQLPEEATRVVVSWTHRIDNQAGFFFDPDQGVRVELWDADNQLLRRLFATKRGDAAVQGCTTKAIDITEFVGQRVRIAFTVENRLDECNAYIDNVALQIELPDWLTPNPNAGELTVAESVDLALTFSGSGLTAGDERYGRLIVETNGLGGPTILPVHLRIVAGCIPRMPPVISLGAALGGFECGMTINRETLLANITAVDDCGTNLTNEIDVTGALGVLDAGAYTFSYRVTDSTGGVGTATRNISVNDTQAPIIAVIPGLIRCDIGADVALLDGVTATDNCDGEPTPDVCLGTVDTLRGGTYRVTYCVADRAGNQGTAVRDYVVPMLLDVDGNGLVEGNVDGVIIMRYLFGFRGTALTAGICPGCDAAKIEQHLDTVAGPR